MSKSIQIINQSDKNTIEERKFISDLPGLTNGRNVRKEASFGMYDILY